MNDIESIKLQDDEVTEETLEELSNGKGEDDEQQRISDLHKTFPKL